MRDEYIITKPKKKLKIPPTGAKAKGFYLKISAVTATWNIMEANCRFFSVEKDSIICSLCNCSFKNLSKFFSNV